MKAKILLLFTLILFTSLAFAQRNCGTMENLVRLKTLDPSLELRMQQIEQQTSAYIAAHPDAERTVITVPVVVHLVYNTASQNISDALINAQIDQLNRDFARINQDAGNTPSVFQGVAVNTNIQFCLAQRNPSGSATTGIERRQTTSTSFSTNDNVKHFSSGGLDAWPAASYLNLWVCNLGQSLLGYAQFPGGPASTDGVVVLYSSVGSIANPNPLGGAYNVGRTATHEVGHWVNLYHIWGDDGNACTGSDLVGDTPNQGSENYGCPAFPHVSCSNGPNGDMFMNYMDYTDDNCMNMYTAGQASRMNALFVSGGSRVGILSSLGCTPPNTSACNIPGGLNTTNVTMTSATLNWSAVSGALSYNVQYKETNASIWNSASTAATSYPLSGLLSNTSYDWKVQTVCSSTGSDFSAASSFSTLSSAGCADVYEANNSSGTATVIATNNDISANIGSTTDIDWFRFTTSQPNTKIKVTLTTLPADYDVVLYNSNLTQLGISQLSGTSSETIIYNTKKQGTYYIKVYGYNGAFNTSQCYTLRASVRNTNYRVTDGGEIEITTAEDVRIYPNPANAELFVECGSLTQGKVQLRISDLLGKEIQVNSFDAVDGFNQFKMDVSQLQKGIYLVEIISNNTSTTSKLVIDK
jgi:hypothetical protein